MPQTCALPIFRFWYPLYKHASVQELHMRPKHIVHAAGYVVAKKGLAKLWYVRVALCCSIVSSGPIWIWLK